MIIRFLHLRGMKPIEIHQQLSETCSEGVMDVKNVRHIATHEALFSSVSIRGTHLAETFRNFRLSCKMVSMDLTDMLALAAICLTVNWRSSITICSTCTIMSSDRLVHGRGSFSLLSHDFRPSVNCRTHERTFFTSMTPSLHVSLNC